jgi:DNA-binding Xre family transcriptional regulator
MNILEKTTHRKILEKILVDRDIKKTDFAVRIGFSKSNYTETLNKDLYSDRMIKRICGELGISTSVFGLGGEVNEKGMEYGNNDSGPTCKQLLEEKTRHLLRAESEIETLKKLVALMEKNQK